MGLTTHPFYAFTQRKELSSFIKIQKERLGGLIPLSSQVDKAVNTPSDGSEDYLGDFNFHDWSNVESRVFTHVQMFPSEKGINNFAKTLEGLELGKNGTQYIGVTDTDPHLMWTLTELRNLEKSLGANPDDQSSVFNYRPSILLSLGTGDGKFLKQILEDVNPYHFCIALRSWDDLVSSFDEIDWLDIWNYRCDTERFKISIVPYETIESLRANILNHKIISIEHAMVVIPGPCPNQEYVRDRNTLNEGVMIQQINYLGFTIDEYNMLWNAAKSLGKSPAIFKKPKKRLGGKFIVCGSGPSLDNNIELIKKAPSDVTIVACASNYKALRSAGIEVDILCLLERGSYEFDNYESIKKEYGLGHTKLFASVTCDYRLHDLFEESMVYFRPQLTPLSVFASDVSQILNFEGPQTVNTGVALCAALGADTVVLVGVDLGCASLNQVRSRELWVFRT